MHSEPAKDPPRSRAQSGGNPVNPLPKPRFNHLRRMTDHRGLWEHARYTTPRTEHGYCTDDNARALIVISRQQHPSSELIELARIYLGFIEQARLPDAGFHNRRNSNGSWVDEIGSDDSQGRAIWALGSVTRRSPATWMQDVALDMFEEQRDFRSAFPRANAYALLGAAEVLVSSPCHRTARHILEHCVEHLFVRDDPYWPWPEERLAYANARLPEALLAAGAVLPDDDLVDSGLRLLEWLVTTETRDDHFSFTPVGGWGPGEPRPGFDQQPVEAAAMADACSRAESLTGDNRWNDRIEQVARWFTGTNDIGKALYDPKTGGCGDGLAADHVNLNRGAESTLAALAVLQQADLIGRTETHRVEGYMN